MANNKEKEGKEEVTGLEMATDRKEAEYDLVKSLLEAADYKNDSENFSTIEIKRGGKFLFSFRVRPLSDDDIRIARKKATVMMDNPQGKKFPRIEKERNSALYNSWLLYLATVEEDQAKIWGQPAVMQKHGLQLPVESIDILLNLGEKEKALDIVLKTSGLNDDGEDEMDEESFLG